MAPSELVARNQCSGDAPSHVCSTHCLLAVSSALWRPWHRLGKRTASPAFVFHPHAPTSLWPGAPPVVCECPWVYSCLHLSSGAGMFLRTWAPEPSLMQLVERDTYSHSPWSYAPGLLGWGWSCAPLHHTAGCSGGCQMRLCLLTLLSFHNTSGQADQQPLVLPWRRCDSLDMPQDTPEGSVH